MKEIITRLDEIIRLLRNEKEERGKIPHTPLKEKGEKEHTHSRARERKQFVKPTVEEVAAHVREKGYLFSADAFWNFYESKGWMVGKVHMRNWKAACVTWQRHAREESRPSRPAAPRRADNWLPATDAQRKEFCDGIEG